MPAGVDVGHQMTRRRSSQRVNYSPIPTVKLQGYIREDQHKWIEEEAARRVGMFKARGRNGARSEIIREAIDVLIEYQEHLKFLAGKSANEQGRSAGQPRRRTVATPDPTDAAALPTSEQVARVRRLAQQATDARLRALGSRSPGSGAPDPQSSGNSGQSG